MDNFKIFGAGVTHKKLSQNKFAENWLIDRTSREGVTKFIPCFTHLLKYLGEFQNTAPPHDTAQLTCFSATDTVEALRY
jgi:hypothetical protein